MNRKHQVEELALFGGIPLFDIKLHVGRPNIGDAHKIHERLDQIIANRWLSNNGPMVQEFEESLAKYLRVKHVIAVCNATIGLEIVIRALGLEGEVIIPSFTFIATAHALQWLGVKPVFCDIEKDTHNIDPERIEELITPQTTGIIGVHVWGRPSNIDRISEIAEKEKLKVIYDAAHAFGCSAGGEMIGNFGDAEVFSFHATKFYNTFEGGAIATNNDELARKVRLMKNFGFSGKDSVISIGTNGKMTEMSAAMGIVGLDSLEEFIEINEKNYINYQQIFNELPGIKLITYDEKEKQNYQYIVVEIDQDKTGITRDILVDILNTENILARKYFYPGCHEMEPYRSDYPDSNKVLPQTELLTKSVMSLPTGTSITAEDIQKIGQLIGFAIDNCDAIKERYG